MRIEIKDKKNFICMFNKIYEHNNISKINGISIDSRVILKDNLFLGIKGSTFNGNKFAKNQSPRKKTMIQKEPEGSLSNLNFTNSKNDTLKKKKVDYSKNIKFVND